MRFLLQNRVFLILIISVFFTQFSKGQTTINTDPKFEQLLNEKRKINQSITTTDKYKIQIFYGESNQAKKILNEFRNHHENIDGTIIFSSPNYKVQVGNFKNKIDAERVRLEILKKYPEALVVRASR